MGSTTPTIRVRRRQAHRRQPAGASIVEMALVLSLFILLIVGILEVGRGFMSYNMLVHAVRESGRRAAVTPSLQQDDGRVGTTLSDWLGRAGLTASRWWVSYTPVLRTGSPVRVGAETEFMPVAMLVAQALWGSTNGVTLRAEVVARYEL